jgi:hypothetical protein
VSEGAVRSLVPPRPNLGPEPWSESAKLDGLWLAVAAIGAVVAGLVAWRIVRRGRSWRNAPDSSPAVLDPTPRGRLVALSITAKSALAARFGLNWRAKTTEELATQPALAELLGPEMLGELIEFLDRVDRIKFAPHQKSQNGRSLEEELEAWDPRIAGLIGKIAGRVQKGKEKPATRSDSRGSEAG